MATESYSKDETLHVTTLIDLKKRRDKLLELKKKILNESAVNENTKEFPKNFPNTSLVISENQDELASIESEGIAYCDTTTFNASCLENLMEINDHGSGSGLTVTSTNNLVSDISKENIICTEINNEQSGLGFDFLSDDSVANPNYCTLSEITNVAPIISTSTDSSNDLLPETVLEREVAVESRVRKRKSDVLSTKRSRNKTLRMLGQEYVGFRKTGEEKFIQDSIKPARQLGQPCDSSKYIRSKVFYCDKFTETERLNIFNEFWKLTWMEKKMFVSSLVDTKTTERKTTERADSRRSATKLYYLKLNAQKMRVCLKTFLGTLGIKEWTVRYWLGEKPNKESTRQIGVALPKLKELVQIFLRAMPKMPSHYCRKESTKLYLEPIIQSKRELYRIYVVEATKQGQKVASRKLFEDVLKDENISLFLPKKDACDLCCSYKAGNITEEIYQQHVSRKDLARQEKTSDKEAAKKGTLHVVTADLQAVKLCPFLKASALYFKTKLMVHNFTIYNLGTKGVTCYWFDETTSDLKASTYASFFVDYLTKIIEESPKDVVIFTDGCTSQNRNVVVSNALLQLAMQKNVVITQKYLEKGHTQMEVDSVHSVIERKLKHREIFLPSQYSSVTKEARLNPSPYEVVTVDHTFFKDYSIKSNLIYDTIRPGRGTGAKCVVDIRVLKYNPNGTIEYKLNYNDEFQPLPQRPKKIAPVIPPQLYTEKVPITKSKYDHLQELKSVIPMDCHEFYDNLPYKNN